MAIKGFEQRNTEEGGDEVLYDTDSDDESSDDDDNDDENDDDGDGSDGDESSEDESRDRRSEDSSDTDESNESSGGDDEDDDDDDGEGSDGSNDEDGSGSDADDESSVSQNDDDDDNSDDDKGSDDDDEEGSAVKMVSALKELEKARELCRSMDDTLLRLHLRFPRLPQPPAALTMDGSVPPSHPSPLLSPTAGGQLEGPLEDLLAGGMPDLSHMSFGDQVVPTELAARAGDGPCAVTGGRGAHIGDKGAGRGSFARNGRPASGGGGGGGGGGSVDAATAIKSSKGWDIVRGAAKLASTGLSRGRQMAGQQFLSTKASQDESFRREMVEQEEKHETEKHQLKEEQEALRRQWDTERGMHLQQQQQQQQRQRQLEEQQAAATVAASVAAATSARTAEEQRIADMRLQMEIAELRELRARKEEEEKEVQRQQERERAMPSRSPVREAAAGARGYGFEELYGRRGGRDRKLGEATYGGGIGSGAAASMGGGSSRASGGYSVIGEAAGLFVVSEEALRERQRLIKDAIQALMEDSTSEDEKGVE